MPTLPTFTVSDAQAARMMTVFGSTQGYKDWLKRQIIDAVRNAEVAAVEVEYAAARDARVAEIEASLNIS